jgi:DNA internalization-related competence protein ComEC/Rec2
MQYILIFLSISFALGIITNYYLPISFIWPLLLILFLIPSLFLYKNEKRFILAICLIMFFFGIAYHGVWRDLPENDVTEIFAECARMGTETPEGGPSPNFGSARTSEVRNAVRTAIIGTVSSPVETRRYSLKKTMTSFEVEVKKVRMPDVGATIYGAPNDDGNGNHHDIKKGAMNRARTNRWQKCQGKIKVNAYNIADMPIQYGDEIRLWGEIKEPPRAMNPGQFDYCDYLAKYGIHLLMTVYGEKSVRNYTQTQILANRNGNGHERRGVINHAPTDWIKNILRSIFTLRDRIKATIDTHITYPYNTILSALLIGARSEIPQDIRDTFVKTGTVHMLAISGLHVSIITGFLFFLLRRLGLRRSITAFFIICFLIFYTLCVGVRFPVLRSTCMGILLIMGMIFDRQKHSMHAVWIALFLILLMQPEAIFLVSLQLSFLTVLSILLFLNPIRALIPYKQKARHEATRMDRLQEYILSGYALSIAVMIGASPLVVYHFYLFSIVSFIANLVLIPLLGFIITSGMFFSFLSLIVPFSAPYCAVFPKIFLALLTALLQIFGNLPGAYFYLRRPHSISLVFYYCMILALYAMRKKVRMARSLVGMIALCVIFLGLHGFSVCGSESEIFFLSAGSANTVVIRTGPKNTIVINPGSAKNVGWTLKPFLMAKGIKKIDALFITSWHKKNWSGIHVLADNFSIKEIYVPHGGGDVPRALGYARYNALKKGDEFYFDKVRFLIDQAAERRVSDQARALTALSVRVSIGDFNALIYPDSKRETLSIPQDIDLVMAGAKASLDYGDVPASLERTAESRQGRESHTKRKPVFRIVNAPGGFLSDAFTYETIVNPALDGCARFRVTAKGSFQYTQFFSAGSFS